jgi:hypothetical protein
MDIRTLGDVVRFENKFYVNSNESNKPGTLNLPSYEKYKARNNSMRSNKNKKESFLLKNVYRVDRNIKMQLAKKRRLESLPKDNMTEGIFLLFLLDFFYLTFSYRFSNPR